MNKIKKYLSPILAIIMIIMTAVPAFAAVSSDTENKPYGNSEFFTYGELSIHYRVFKAQDEKAKVFMIHGFAMSSACWVELANRLSANGYTCVAADLPDFGYSTREDESSTLYPREDIMHALMTSLGGEEKWYLAGHSMGGYIALSLATKYPESVKNLLLFGTSGNKGQPDSLKKMMTNKAFVSVMAPMMELMSRLDLVVKLILAAALMDNSYLKTYPLSEITSPFKIKGTGAGALYSFSTLPTTDFEAVEKMPPIFYINGDRDVAIKESDRAFLRKHLPENSTDITVKGGGHLFIENRADETAEYVLKFLAENR